MFTYEDVDDGSVMFKNINTSDPVPVGSTLAGLNLHLNSQPDDLGNLPKPNTNDPSRGLMSLSSIIFY